MSDSEKTKQELINELEALRAKMNGKQTDEPVSGAAPTGGGMTRRDILAASWVAPVILTVPLGAVISQRAQAQSPTPAPTSAPTQQPTSAPTAPTTASPPHHHRVPTSSHRTTNRRHHAHHQPPSPPSAPTQPVPTTVATSPPTSFPTAAGSGPIPVELSDFDIS